MVQTVGGACSGCQVNKQCVMCDVTDGGGTESFSEGEQHPGAEGGRGAQKAEGEGRRDDRGTNQGRSPTLLNSLVVKNT